jgi:hypothetical protein
VLRRFRLAAREERNDLLRYGVDIVPVLERNRQGEKPQPTEVFVWYEEVRPACAGPSPTYDVRPPSSPSPDCWE